MKKQILLKSLFFLLLLLLSISVFPELVHQNKGKSRSIGTVKKGTIENPWLLPYSGTNFRYFSPLSYYVLNNGYANDKVYRTLLAAYKECEKTCKNIQFRIMECSNKKGGQMLIHKTHQNGRSVDFMIPKKSGTTQSRILDRLGMWHYLLEFTNAGRFTLHQKIQIDFETMGKHILALDKAARKNGLRIKMVILKIELKDDFYKTTSGQQVRKKGIYFARSLPDLVNRMHDDHYHIDFEVNKGK